MIDSVVVWKWHRPPYRSTYTAEHVNTMRRMVARHYPHPHRFVCITDDAKGLDPEIEVSPFRNDFGGMRNPSYRGGPNCYPRLRAFSREFRDVAGDRFVSLDLDCVITGDLTPLFNRAEDFVAWGAPSRNGPALNGSFWLIRAGSRAKVWDRFDPRTSGHRAHAAGFKGSDQGWIRYCLGPRGATLVGAAQGVYSYKFELDRHHHGRLPENARLVVFHGKPDPWDEEAQRRSPWIQEHYR